MFLYIIIIAVICLGLFVYVYGKNLIDESPKIDFMQEFTIKKGETVKLADGLRFTFKGHSHKTTFVDQISPLIISATYEFSNKKIEDYHYVFPKAGETWGWQWENYTFTGSDYAYDEYMRIRADK